MLIFHGKENSLIGYVWSHDIQLYISYTWLILLIRKSTLTLLVWLQLSGVFSRLTLAIIVILIVFTTSYLLGSGHVTFKGWCYEIFFFFLFVTKLIEETASLPERWKNNNLTLQFSARLFKYFIKIFIMSKKTRFLLRM